MVAGFTNETLRILRLHQEITFFVLTFALTRNLTYYLEFAEPALIGNSTSFFQNIFCKNITEKLILHCVFRLKQNSYNMKFSNFCMRYEKLNVFPITQSTLVLIKSTPFKKCVIREVR